MIFKDRMKLADQYEEWLKGYPEISDCPASVIAFLDLNGFLKDERELNQWTPCSEGLPSIETDVLLTSWNGKNQYVGWMDAFLKWHSEDEEVISGYEPIAWMPLPEPYKPQERSE